MRRIFKASMISKKSLCFQKETYKFKRRANFSQVAGIVLGIFVFYFILIKTALQGECIVKVGLESGPHGAGLEYLVPTSSGMGIWSHGDGIGGGNSSVVQLEEPEAECRCRDSSRASSQPSLSLSPSVRWAWQGNLGPRFLTAPEELMQRSFVTRM